MSNNVEIVDVLRNYNLQVDSIDTYPNIYKLKTNYGPKIISKWNDLLSIKEAHKYREALARLGFRKVDRFISTKEGEPFVFYNNTSYSLTDEIIGRMPSANEEKDIKIISTTLAQFHLVASKIQTNSNLRLWSENYISGLGQFTNIEDFIYKKKKKNEIDEMLIDSMPRNLEQIKLSIDKAKRVEKLAIKNDSQPKLCHGNLYLSSYIIDEYDEGWIIDLTVPTIDVLAYDIAKFITRLYKESNYNDATIYNFLEYYQKVIPLRTEDKLWILTYIAYPHALWKFLYIHYVVKVTNSNNILKEYQIVNDQIIKVSGLYQSLFTYFKL